MSLGEQIRIRREELGITQTELARRVGVSQRSAVANARSRPYWIIVSNRPTRTTPGRSLTGTVTGQAESLSIVCCFGQANDNSFAGRQVDCNDRVSVLVGCDHDEGRGSPADHHQQPTKRSSDNPNRPPPHIAIFLRVRG